MNLTAQDSVYKFWVELRDKEYNSYSLDNPSGFLSERSLDRRTRFGIPLDSKDLPVSDAYLDSIRQFPLEILYSSKWMNAAVVQSYDSTVASSLQQKPYVDKVECLYHWNIAKKSSERKWEDEFSYGGLPTDNQLEMLQGHVLHREGFMGHGKLIAVLDGGFSNVDNIEAFEPLFSSGRIAGTRTYIEPDSSFYYPWNGSHGTKVLSVMAASLPGLYMGSAPEASYLLIQTEDTRSEFRIEESNWLAGAEYADSMGADIINSSLGYSIGFTDTSQNYRKEEMDGKTALVTRAAQIAARKGMIVVTSAGNSGRVEHPWGIITAPADADSILAIGAVDSTGNRAVFSSRGNTSDGRIKPDIMTQGVLSWLVSQGGDLARGNGTSYSSPLAAGLTACLWQKFPAVKNIKLMESIRESSCQNMYPDSLYGYGIPNLALAGWIITGERDKIHPGTSLRVYPNPATDHIRVSINSRPDFPLHYRITDLGGRLVDSGQVDQYGISDYRIGLAELPSGIYLMILDTGSGIYRKRFIKL